MTKTTPPTQEEILSWVRHCARFSRRCPTREEFRSRFGSIPHNLHLPRLAYEGLLRIELYGRNWRTIEIDGMRTQECPWSETPWKVIDRRPLKS